MFNQLSSTIIKIYNKLNVKPFHSQSQAWRKEDDRVRYLTGTVKFGQILYEMKIPNK